jgi:hypothetical protein
MQRLRLYDVRNSRLPALLGICQTNIPKIAEYVNSAQRRLLYCKEAGDESWWGTWSEIVFNVSRTTPYITFPRDIARIEYVNACNVPIQIHNQFFEYLDFGNGRMPKQWRACGWNGCMPTQMYSRNNAVTFLEMTSAPQYLTAMITDAQDVNKRFLAQGLDANNNPIYSQDNGFKVLGQFVNFTQPFASTPMTLNQINGIQKDVTVGPVHFYQTDPTTGAQVLLLTMQPQEQTASYRRYYLHALPQNCCNTPGSETQVQVTALAKMELLPVVGDTDYLLIQNLEAITEECQSVRYSTMDTPTAKQMAAERHQQAVRMLNGELAHYLGIKDTAVGIRPFGSARLERQAIGTLL